MSRLLALLLAASAFSFGCRKAPSYEAYREAGAGFSLETPKGWPHDSGPLPSDKAAVTVEFIGDAAPQHEGVVLGAVLSVTRLSRKAPDKTLTTTKALFPDDAATPAESKPYSREYEHGGPSPMHQSTAAVPMRVEGRVFRTADAFFVVEMRAVRSKFERNRHALDRALATFHPG